MNKTEELLKDSPDYQVFLQIQSYQNKLIHKYQKRKITAEQLKVYFEKIREWVRTLDRRYNTND
jgi:hypothetical protein